MKIILDAFGGDNSPDCIINGGLLALEKYSDLEIVFVGYKDVLEAKLSQRKYDKIRVSIVESNSVITNDDSPAESIRSKKDSSIVIGYDHLKNNDDCSAFISAGSTGGIQVKI